MIISISQPAYLPWLGYFDRIAASDVHVVLDHVQFEKNSFTNRNRIRTPDGAAWLTIPLLTSGNFGALEINRLRVADKGRWAKKHAQSLKLNYGRSPAFKSLWPRLEPHFPEQAEPDRQPPLFLPPVDALNRASLDLLGISTPLVHSSAMELESAKSHLVLDICRQVGASQYLSGSLGRNYLNLDLFADAGIEVMFHDYSPATYPQIWSGFHSHLAAVDAIFALGEMEARRIMAIGRRIARPS
ncbi:MAG: WbqC family protein [Rhizobiaceae bacterium]